MYQWVGSDGYWVGRCPQGYFWATRPHDWASHRARSFVICGGVLWHCPEQEPVAAACLAAYETDA